MWAASCACAQRRLRLGIHALDDEQHLELVGAGSRCARSAAQQMRYDGRLAIERHQHRVERAARRRHRAERARVRGGGRRRSDVPQRERAQRHHQQEGDRHDREQRDRASARAPAARRRKRRDEAGKRRTFASAAARLRRKAPASAPPGPQTASSSRCGVVWHRSSSSPGCRDARDVAIPARTRRWLRRRSMRPPASAERARCTEETPPPGGRKR